MSLNCLTRQALRRTDSSNDRDHCGKEKVSRKSCCVIVDRNWSGTLSPAAHEQIRSEAMPVVPREKIKKGHRRLNITFTTYEAVGFEADDAEPRLVRSCGMRRDWSFEKLRKETRGRFFPNSIPAVSRTR